MDLAALYSSRAGLEPDAPTFAGRRDTLTDIFRRLANPVAMPSVAVLGPRRYGKTSLLKQILSATVRKQFRDEAVDWDVAYIDLSSSPWRGFDAFRRRFLRILVEARRFAMFEPNPEDCIEDVVSGLLKASRKPLVVILDEFDCIAPELGKAEQAELRGAIVNVPRFAMIVGVAREPTALLEHIGDVASDLAPVLAIALPRLAGLTEAEARDLIRTGRVLAGLPQDIAAETALLQWAGRHPLLLQAACYAWYGTVGGSCWRDLSKKQVKSVQEKVFEEVGSQIPFVIRGLGSQARLLVSEQLQELTEPAKHASQQDIADLGLVSRALIRFGGAKGSVWS